MRFWVISKNYLNISFFEVAFAPSASIFSNTLALYSKDLKLLSVAISGLKLLA